MFVKICGIKKPEQLNFIEKYADATGVVVRSRSKRVVGLEKAKEIISTAKIPVFVVSTENTLEGWEKIIQKTGATYIQVHSDMKEDDFEKLRQNFGGIISKAMIVPKNTTMPDETAEKFISKALSYSADYFLLDSGAGSGKLHDFRISRKFAKNVKNTILAGGLNPKNVKEIARYVNPFGVDVSSGVEKDGVKNIELIKSFVEVLK